MLDVYKDEKDELLQNLMKIGFQVCELELWGEPDVSYDRWEDVHYRWSQRIRPHGFARYLSLSTTEGVEPPADNRMEAKT